jgi:DHA3 family macrolide efflux protein-like MFS transporter
MQDSHSGLKGFAVVWFGQVVSLLGSAMTWFALTVWAYEITGQATALALLSFFAFGPTILLGPVAGVLVDRWSRKTILILSDSTACLATLVVLVLYATGTLQIWHLYVIAVLAGSFQALEYPAYASAVTMMVPKQQYARASGMLELAWTAPSVLAPLLAGILLGTVGITGIMTLDVLTFVFATGTLLFVSIPQPPRSKAGLEGQGNFWKQSAFGFRYIWHRPGLLGLQLLYAFGNLVEYSGFTLFAPMILARTDGNELVLGSVQSAGAFGGLIGGALLSVWGGPKRRIHGVLIGWALSGMGILLMAIGYDPTMWLLASFTYTFFEPIVNGSNRAIWQAKVAPDVQGRVFATQLLLSQATIPIAMLLAGPLADRVLEPAMMPGATLAETFGWLVGVGPGAGMALMIAFAGVVAVVLPLCGYALPPVRDVERILPDYDAVLAEASP